MRSCLPFERRPSRARTAKTVFALFAAICLNNYSALAFEVPDWPKPPTESDCHAFRSAIDDFYRNALADYRACSQNASQCGDAPRRAGAGAVKRTEITQCFQAAAKHALVDLTTEFEKKIKEINELNTMQRRIRNYKQLSDSEKLELHRDIATKINGEINDHELSQKLTDDSIARLTEINISALAALNRELKAIEDKHLELLMRPAEQDKPIEAISQPSSDLAARLERAKEQNRKTGTTERHREQKQAIREEVARSAPAIIARHKQQRHDQEIFLAEQEKRFVECAELGRECAATCDANIPLKGIVNEAANQACNWRCSGIADECTAEASEDEVMISAAAQNRERIEKASNEMVQNAINRQNAIDSQNEQYWAEQNRLDAERQQQESEYARELQRQLFESFQQMLGSGGTGRSGGGSGGYRCGEPGCAIR